MNNIQTEADVISLIGFETILKFNYISDNLITFSTVIPNTELLLFEITFFAKKDVTDLTFFCYDSFSSFLLKYKIFEVKTRKEDTEISETIYHRKYN